VDSSNAVFKVFAKEDANLQSTLHLLPSALHKTGNALAKVALASNQVGPALHTLLPFAKALGPANEATRRLAVKATPIIKNEIRPFAREILPTVDELAPSTQELSEAFPKLATSFSVVNEFFNELAFNPGKGGAGFDFFLAWANHNLNSVVANADAHGTIGRSLIYFNCKVLPVIEGAATVNETVKLLTGLLRLPSQGECESLGLLPTAKAAAARAHTARRHGPFSSLNASPFALRSAAKGAGG
jgi:phospholipid/cholesterol/gamma-HCH transport system substrate-binding protein